MKILIYTYGNNEMGMGHVYRMTNLSNELVKNGNTTEFVGPTTLHDGQYDCVIADALDIEESIMKKLRNITSRLITLDNVGTGRELSDIVINILYRTTPKMKHEINNVDFLILNKHFLKYHKKNKKIKQQTKNILIAQGGSDTHNVIPKIINNLPIGYKYHILIGPKANYQIPECKHKIIHNSKNPWKKFNNMDMAVCGGGMMLFELMSIGVPCIALTHEQKEMETITRLGNNIETIGMDETILNHAIEELSNNYERRRTLSERGKEMIDCMGLDRIIRLIDGVI